MGGRLRGAGLVMVTALALAGACDEAPDPLDADVLQQLARTQGDARGRDLAGDYLLAGTRDACDCPPAAALAGTPLQGVDLCAALGVSIGGLPAAVYQEDGLLAVDLAGLIALFGGVDADGSFAVAGLFDASTLIGAGDLHARAEGTIVEGRLEATLVNRMISDSDLARVDCRATSTLSGARLP